MMQYEDTIDESRRYLRLALEQIGKHTLPTDPVNYCVWYEYAAGKRRELNDDLDRRLTDGARITAEIILQLYEKHILGARETVNAMVREELKKVFSEIMSAIVATNNDFSLSGNHLECIQESLVPNMSESDVEIIITKIKNEIAKLESSSSAFKNQLAQATQEIEELKSKMARYRSEALKDPLTRIDNRRGFDTHLQAAIAKASGSGNSLCLIITDIDHFKKVNDTHGHLVGDNVIRMVAATLKNAVKGKDTVARIGGEEFAILLPDTPYTGALKLAEDIRLTFERLDLKKKNSGESLGSITLSFGVTVYRSGETNEAFVDRADKALYRSKQTGRNKVTGQ